MIQKEDVITCTRCHLPVDVSRFNQPDLMPCGGCGRGLQTIVFPAFYRKKRGGVSGEQVQAEGESSCYQHPAKRAVALCDTCGRFMCALCELEVAGKRICPECLEKGSGKQQIAELENRRTLYDTMALMLALAPLPMLLAYFLLPLTVITAMAAMFVTVRHWKKPLGLTRHSRWRFVVAFILGLLQVIAWGFAFAGLWVLIGQIMGSEGL